VNLDQGEWSKAYRIQGVVLGRDFLILIFCMKIDTSFFGRFGFDKKLSSLGFMLFS